VVEQQTPVWQDVVEQVEPTPRNCPWQRESATIVQPESVQQAPVAKTQGEVVQVAPSTKSPPAAAQETRELLAHPKARVQQRPVMSHGWVAQVLSEYHTLPEAQASCGTSWHWPVGEQQTPITQEVAVQAVSAPRNCPVHSDAATIVQPVVLQQAPVEKEQGEVVQVTPLRKTPPEATQVTPEVFTQVPTPATIMQQRPEMSHGRDTQDPPDTHALPPAPDGQSNCGTSWHWPVAEQQTPAWQEVAVQAVPSPRNCPAHAVESTTVQPVDWQQAPVAEYARLGATPSSVTEASSNAANRRSGAVSTSFLMDHLCGKDTGWGGAGSSTSA
jgi:hypothetical protein